MSKWSGDGRYHLPAKTVEPYRLWFEFLKTVLTDPDLKVNKRRYQSWDLEKVAKQTFTQWWAGETWRKLFAMDNSVRILERSEKLPTTDPSIVVRLPLGKDAKEIRDEVMALLEEHGATDKVSKTRQGKFSLTQGFDKGFLKKTSQARMMLRLYRYWLGTDTQMKDSERLSTAVLQYLDWATKRTEEVKGHKNYRDVQPYIPDSFLVYADYLRQETEGKTAKGRKKISQIHISQGRGQSAEDARRAAKRFLRKAREIAATVAAGEFPGKY